MTAADSFRAAAAQRILTKDGAYGTMIQAEKLVEADRSSEAVITATIDLEQAGAQRHAWGVFRDRRPDL